MPYSTVPNPKNDQERDESGHRDAQMQRGKLIQALKLRR